MEGNADLVQTLQRLFERSIDIIYLKGVVRDKVTNACMHKDTLRLCIQRHTIHTHIQAHVDILTTITLTLASSLCVTNLPKARRRGRMSLRSYGDNELGLKCITLRLAEEWAPPPPCLSHWCPIHLPARALPPSSNPCCHVSQVY